MRRLSNVFLTISAVMSFIFLAGFAIAAIVMFASAGLGGLVAEEGGEAAGIAYAAGMITGGVVLLMFAVMALLSGIFAVKAKKNASKGALILAIVFSALSCTEFGIAGGILGLIANARNE